MSWVELGVSPAMFITRLLEGTDVCFAPVLSSAEAARHPHNVARQTFIEVGGVLQQAPAPRFGRTPADQPDAPPMPGHHTREILSEAGFTDADIETQLRAGSVYEPG